MTLNFSRVETNSIPILGAAQEKEKATCFLRFTVTPKSTITCLFISLRHHIL